MVYYKYIIIIRNRRYKIVLSLKNWIWFLNNFVNNKRVNYLKENIKLLKVKRLNKKNPNKNSLVVLKIWYHLDNLKERQL